MPLRLDNVFEKKGHWTSSEAAALARELVGTRYPRGPRTGRNHSPVSPRLRPIVAYLS
jgi:hypothetical protein